MTRQSGTHAVVVVPTRELCLQILDVLALVLRRYHWLVIRTPPPPLGSPGPLLGAPRALQLPPPAPRPPPPPL